jgi:hypothetical protein
MGATGRRTRGALQKDLLQMQADVRGRNARGARREGPSGVSYCVARRLHAGRVDRKASEDASCQDRLCQIRRPMSLFVTRYWSEKLYVAAGV